MNLTDRSGLEAITNPSQLFPTPTPEQQFFNDYNAAHPAPTTKPSSYGAPQFDQGNNSAPPPLLSTPAGCPPGTGANNNVNNPVDGTPPAASVMPAVRNFGTASPPDYSNTTPVLTAYNDTMSGPTDSEFRYLQYPQTAADLAQANSQWATTGTQYQTVTYIYFDTFTANVFHLSDGAGTNYDGDRLDARDLRYEFVQDIPVLGYIDAFSDYQAAVNSGDPVALHHE